MKCAKVVKKPLSEYVRELLHTEMQKHRLDEDGSRILREQIAAAVEARGRKKAANKSKKRAYVVDKITIPASVRKNPKFVKE